VSAPKPDPKPASPKPIEQVAEETCAAIVRHLQTDTAADDARREAERDARIKAALEDLAREGKVPRPEKPEA
jgi:hypothetical protein